MKSTNLDHTVPAWDGNRLCLAAIGGAIAVATVGGVVEGATAAARSLLMRYKIVLDSLQLPVSPRFWAELTRTPMGEAIIWRIESDGPYLGCTRYHLGESHVLLVMREMTDRSYAITQRLHEQRLEATGRLMATIAHDLRTPLASILFNAHFLENYWNTASPADTVASIEEIRTACERLRRSIDGLLDFARLEAPLLTRVSLLEVFDRVASLLRPVLREGGHVLAFNLDDAALHVRGNGLILEQIMVNLIMNAIESTRQSATVEIRTRQSGLSSHRMVLVEIADNGPGIPSDLSTRVFDPFFSTKPHGTGLGLTTAREAATQLGGDLTLESSQGGACFVLTLLASASPDGSLSHASEMT